MAIGGLFNKKTSWKRRVVTRQDEFGANIHTETLIASDISCAFQEVTGELIENEPVESNRKRFDLFLFPDEDIQAEDILIFEGSENYRVQNVATGAGRGHHLEVLVEQNKNP